jgi:hypothetical protein
VPARGDHVIYTSLPWTWRDADGGWALPSKNVRRLAVAQVPCLSSQYERFAFGISSQLGHGLLCPMAPGPHPRAGRTGSPHMATILLSSIRH